MVVDDPEPLRFGGVPGPQSSQPLMVVEGETRAAPGDDVFRLSAVLPVGLEVCCCDGRAVLEDGVLTQLHRPDGQVVVGGDGGGNPGHEFALLVEHERRAEDVGREQPVGSRVAPRRHRVPHLADRGHYLRVVQVQARCRWPGPWLDTTRSRGGRDVCGYGSRRFGCGLWRQRGIAGLGASRRSGSLAVAKGALSGRPHARLFAESAGLADRHRRIRAKTAATAEMVVNTRNIDLETVDAAWFRIWDTSSAWRRMRS